MGLGRGKLVGAKHNEANIHIELTFSRQASDFASCLAASAMAVLTSESV